MKKSPRPSPAVLIAILALVVALGAPSYAAKLITGKQIKNNSVAGKDIKNNSVTGKDVKNGSLLKSDLKGDVVTAVSFPRKKVNATSGATAAAAQAAAPEVRLFKQGTISIYGKCWTDTSVNSTEYGIFVKTSSNYAVFDSRSDTLPGGPDFQDFLNISSSENDRELEGDDTGPDDATMDAQDDSDFTVFSRNGSALRGWTGGAAKNGNLAGGNGVYGSGNVCLFTGGAFLG